MDSGADRGNPECRRGFRSRITGLASSRLESETSCPLRPSALLVPVRRGGVRRPQRTGEPCKPGTGCLLGAQASSPRISPHGRADTSLQMNFPPLLGFPLPSSWAGSYKALASCLPISVVSHVASGLQVYAATEPNDFCLIQDDPCGLAERSFQARANVRRQSFLLAALELPPAWPPALE